MSWLLTLALLAGAAQADAPADIVTKMWAQYASRLVKQDVDGLADLFADNGRLMEPNVDDLVGRAMIRERLKIASEQRMRPADLRVVPREVASFNGLIVDQGDYIQTMAPQGDPRRAVDYYGRYIAIWAEQPDSTWKIARLMLSPKRQPAPR